MNKKPLIIIIGESGSGKSSTISYMEKLGLKRVVTYTTRPKRDGETDGVDYHFISEDKFFDMIAHNEFAEHASYRGWRYGTPKAECLEENTVIALTPAGMRSLKREEIPCISFYLDVDRRSRLIKILERGDDIEEAYRRSLSDVGQFDGISKEVDYIIKNDHYQFSAAEIAKKILIICATKSL